jgi:phosphosulfolactate synthase (CoM biosynthesis protein A)
MDKKMLEHDFEAPPKKNFFTKVELYQNDMNFFNINYSKYVVWAW